MKVVRLHGTRDLRLEEEPLPRPRTGERLLHVSSVGICGSDLHWFSEQGIGDAKLNHPLVLGHEFSAIGERGERFAVDPAIPCRECEICLQGHPNLCPQVRFAGHGDVDGALREYMTWDEQCLFPIPDSISDEDGAMLEPLGVAIHAVDLAHLEPGMSIGVFGCGPIGLLVIQLARLWGAVNILATDRLSHRVDAAQALGASRAWCVESRLDDSIVRSATGGRGVDAAFEVAGGQGAVDDAFAAVAPGGRVILAGIPDDDRTSFTASVARRKGLTIKLVRRMKHTYPRAIHLVSEGLVDVRSLVTHRFPLAKAHEAFETAEKREGLKVMINVR
jgi:L-iditol 2-dehydrogenase